ncbi:MAG: DUF11 domain-containing protein, partial [Thermoplasmata archaeon]
NYVMVQHLQETSGTHYDSTGYDNDGSPEGGVIQDVIGKIDGADDFDGNDDFIDCGDDSSVKITGNVTLSWWVYFENVHPVKRSHGQVFTFHYREYSINIDTLLGKITFIHGNGSSYEIIDSSYTNTLKIASVWHKIDVVRDMSSMNISFYANGDLLSTNPFTIDDISSSNHHLRLGRTQGTYLEGMQDEFQISNIVRSPDWIKAQYLSMSNNFTTFGDEEVVTWKPSWSYRKKLTFNNSGQSEALVNFPVLVNLSLSNFDYSKAKLDGTDLRFIAADNTTELKYHIEYWNARSDHARYTIYFNNTGDRDADVVWINDTLPVGVTFFRHDAHLSSSSSPFLTNFNQIGKTLHFEFQDVPQGEHSFNITVLLNPDVTLGEIITNWAFCNFTNNIGEKMPETSASASFEVLVTRMPKILVEKSANKATALPGDFLQYTIYFNNTGQVAAETVWINDTLPAEVNYLSDSSATELGTKTGDFNWIFTDVAPGNHLFVINVSLGNIKGGTSINNNVSLEYTAVGGNMMPSSHAWANMTVAHYTILKQGWNLISIPLIQSDTNIDEALSSIAGLYDIVQWYDRMDTNDHWKHNKVGKPFGNDLFELDESKGFWIHITPPGETLFPYKGTQPTVDQTISLYPGWNMVGYPSLTSYDRTVGLNNLTFDTHVDAIWTYNSTTQKWKELSPTDYFELGRGYYIHAKSECEWVVPL